MMRRFKVIVPSFNSIDYLPKTLESIEKQTDPQFDVCVIDDASTLHLQQEIITDFCQRNHWKSHFHDKNYGALYGLVHAINDFDCTDDDVIVVVDGDDWLAHPHVLEHLRKIYNEKDCYITWGQCEVWPVPHTPVKYAQPIPPMVIDQKLYRQVPFVFWHLGTFKYYLWRHIRDADLRDVDGQYLKVMKDKATLFPMLEMAGSKVHFVHETLYIYNIDNPLNDYANTTPEEHKRVDELIRKLPIYETLERCKTL